MLNSGFELLILHSHSTDQQLSNFGILSLISVERHFLFIATHMGALYNSLTDHYFCKVKHFAVGFANTVELWWLEHLLDQENKFESGVVRASEG